jgi:crotonobetainyl-CoA:carnitine CoA-transferase CaiB-like acyl-CoA transferase
MRSWLLCTSTGQGNWIEVPLFESEVSWLANRAQEYLVSGEDMGRMGNAHPSIVPYETFIAADKPFSDRCWKRQAICRLLSGIGP